MFSLSLSLKFPDAHLNESLLGNVFDSMQLSCSDPKKRGMKFSAISHQPRYPIHKRVFLTSFRDGSPKAESYWRSRDVSEPQLISSTNYMRESWYLNFGSAHTEGDIATLSIDNIGLSAITTTRGTLDACASLLSPLFSKYPKEHAVWPLCGRR
ncbi:hypothetical protein PAXRUDRAFT_571316 [Paxillus rubicundulus Ve08.2h10]|uniref:Uncharacterized protein n=1 Tax=Paxillus rubicundulus Ve08.2h10 TaxID=930991 RepID=A0A0D0BQR7_9AGAM|nr:hypothetical protein PAXRUDRAFT_571316 [Paxillus rubicundulus Ve08.2h10]